VAAKGFKGVEAEIPGGCVKLCVVDFTSHDTPLHQTVVWWYARVA